MHAEADYSPEELDKVAELDKVITESEKAELVDTIIVKTQGFVNGNIKEGDKEPVTLFKRLLALYKGIDREALRENMRYFLSAIMPVCEEYGVNMCVHPDDPPFQVLGLPRIVTDEADIAWTLVISWYRRFSEGIAGPSDGCRVHCDRDGTGASRYYRNSRIERSVRHRHRLRQGQPVFRCDQDGKET